MKRARFFHLWVTLVLVAWGWSAFAQSKDVPSVQSISALKEQATNGDAKAQYNLGGLYYKGQGVPQDNIQAAAWFRKAADQGDAHAQNILGWFYFNGWATKMDNAQAAMWFRKAAEQGDAESEYDLGFCYDRGWGVPKDHVQAAYWYRKAADQGHTTARGNLSEMQSEDRTEDFSLVATLLIVLLVLGIIGYGIYAKVGLSGIKAAYSLMKSFLAWVFPWCGVAVIGYVIFTFADNRGYIQHTVETTISARSDWLPGESKECLSYTRKREWATFQDKEVGYAMPWVKCDDGPDHHMKVSFYGRKVQPEFQTIGWRCTRNEVSFLNDNSFTCYQMGGER